MHQDATGRMILEVKQPLLEVLRHLSTHLSEIHSNWLRLLKRYHPCGKHSALLAGLHLAPQAQHLRSTAPQAYRERSERQGQELAQQGVPAECAAVAVALYVECCLPYVLSDDFRKAERVKAFARWASVYQFFLLSGYAQHADRERRLMQERIGRVERRSQDFSAQLGDAYEKERRRLAQDLHDEIGHDLIVLKLYTEVIALDLKKGDLSQLRGKLKESVAIIKHALTSVRHLTFDLGPAVWGEQGFVFAVRLYVRQFSSRTGIKVRLYTSRLKADLPARYETAMYKVLQGALSNVVAHANAHHVKITLASERSSVTMKVFDDGKGFDVRRKLREPFQSYGLRAMQDRIQLLGGTIEFASQPARGRAAQLGTEIELRLPLHGMEAT